MYIDAFEGGKRMLDANCRLGFKDVRNDVWDIAIMLYVVLARRRSPQPRTSSNSKASKRRHLTVFTHTYHTDKRMFIY